VGPRGGTILRDLQMVVVGLTGNIGSGKSVIAQMFGRHGAKIIEADRFGHAALERRSPCFGTVVKAFGEGVFADGIIDRKKIGEIVFKDPEQLKKLVHIVHPVMKRQMAVELEKNAAKKAKIVVFDAALLFEMHLHRYVDWIVVVKATRRQMIERAAANLKLPKAEVVRRLKMQMPLREKIRCADFIIDNTGTLTETKRQVNELCQELQQMERKP
jgi:dephospho-CoA kinase